MGETLAARYLMRHGASVLARNVHVGRGEIDLVVELHGRRVAVEVKTARNQDPVDKFDDAKAHQVRSLASRLGVYRVDLVTVTVFDDAIYIHWYPGAA